MALYGGKVVWEWGPFRDSLRSLERTAVPLMKRGRASTKYDGDLQASPVNCVKRIGAQKNVSAILERFFKVEVFQ